MPPHNNNIQVLVITGTNPQGPNGGGTDRMWQFLIATAAAVLGIVVGTPLLSIISAAN